MSTKHTAFYHNKKEVQFDFSAKQISSDGGLPLLYKLARKSKLIKRFCELIPDRRNPDYIVYTIRELVMQRVLLLACGYQFQCQLLPVDAFLSGLRTLAQLASGHSTDEPYEGMELVDTIDSAIPAQGWCTGS